MILATGTKLEVTLPNGAGSKFLQTVTLEDLERKYCLSVLDMTGWRVRGKNGAAEILGLKPTTLTSRMAKLGIRRPTS
jgi:transcriptional regulator with GAF, ATPase, and Fis domain